MRSCAHLLSGTRDYNGRSKQKLWTLKTKNHIYWISWYSAQWIKICTVLKTNLFTSNTNFSAQCAAPLRLLAGAVVPLAHPPPPRPPRPPPTPLWGSCWCVDGVCVCVCVCAFTRACLFVCWPVRVRDVLLTASRVRWIFSMSAGIPLVRGPLRSFHVGFLPTFRKKLRPRAPTVCSKFRSTATKTQDWIQPLRLQLSADKLIYYARWRTAFKSTD